MAGRQKTLLGKKTSLGARGAQTRVSLLRALAAFSVFPKECHHAIVTSSLSHSEACPVVKSLPLSFCDQMSWCLNLRI